jgi:hypothetical protein
MVFQNNLLMAAASTIKADGTVTYISSNDDQANLSSYTFSSQDIGTPASGRIVLVTAHVTGSSPSITAISVGGNACTKATGVNGVNPEDHVAMWYVELAAGATGDVVVTVSVTSYSCAINVYNINGNIDATPEATVTDNGASPNILTITAPAVGVLIAVGSNRGGVGTSSFTNLTERKETLASPSLLMTTGSDAFATQDTNRAVKFNYTAGSTTTGCACIASWGPP